MHSHATVLARSERIVAAPSPFDLFREAKFFGSLDGLRAISIIAVVWFHATGHAYRGVLGAGHLGVQLFFAISGFLITTLLVRESRRTGTIGLKNFYMRRTLRIFPLYYAVLAVYVAVVLVVESNSQAGKSFLGNFPSFLSYTSNWFVDLGQGNRVIFYFAWSLATEEQFYLCWPSIVRFAKRWWVTAIAIVVALTGTEALRLAVEGGLVDGQLLLTRIVLSFASPIGFGCLAAVLLDRQRGFEAVFRVAGRPWSAPMAVVLLLGAISLEVREFVLAISMTLLVVSTVIRADHSLRTVLELAALRYVGTISYGMYLWHMLAMNVARRGLASGFSRAAARAPSAELVFVVALPLTILMASLSHRYFEQYFLRLKERFA